jgi:hypothetical protein
MSGIWYLIIVKFNFRKELKEKNMTNKTLKKIRSAGLDIGRLANIALDYQKGSIYFKSEEDNLEFRIRDSFNKLESLMLEE